MSSFYTPITFTNLTGQKINATNMNYTQSGIGSAHDRIDTLEAGGGGGLFDPLTADLTLNNGVDLILGTSTGTKIGTATSQKLSFYNSTPIVQPSSTTDLRTALINLGLYASGGATPLDLNGGTFTSGGLAVDTNTLFVDATNNRVGVGTATPAHGLDVRRVGITDKVAYFRSTYPSGTGGGQHQPVHVDVFHSATDLTPATGLSTGITSTMIAGNGFVAGTGTITAGDFSTYVQGSGNAANEHCGLFSVVRYDNTTTPGRAWLGDFSVHGAIAVQQSLLSGINMLINNHFNGSPTNGSVGMAIVTRSGSGGSLDGAHSAAETYPVDVGLAVVGHSAIAGTGIGFTTGIRVGGTSGGWMQSGTSRMGTGLHIRDYATQGILINNRTSGATVPAMVVEGGNGPVLIGATSAINATSLFEVSSASAADPLVTFGSSGVVGTYTAMLRNAGAICEWFITGSAGNKLTGTAAADAGIKISGTNKSFHLGGTSNKVVTVTAADTLGFFAVTPVSKRTGWAAATGTATRTTFDTATVSTADLAQRVKALIDDLTSYGLIGA